MASTARHDRAFWERLIDDFETSGETHALFAHHQGVTVGALRYWLYRLRRERDAHDGARTVRLVPVTVASAPPSELVEVGVDGLVVRFRAGTDTGYVAGLVTALRTRA